MAGSIFKIQFPKPVDGNDMQNDINAFLTDNNTNGVNVWHWSALGVSIANFRDWQLEIYENEALAALFKLNYGDHIVSQHRIG
jgi:hypothetical protein